ncbi:MAG: PadR family transcriptional regulator, partial [Brevibacterium aurantiacum]
MSLRSALLALLRIGPMSGYELQKQFSQSVGHVWHAPDSQIYPELRKMATEELIVAEEQTRGSAGMRRVYHVTEAGERAFTDWMNGPLKYQRTRDAAHLRAAYLESADQAAVYAFLNEHIAHWKSELQVWEDEIATIEALESP